MNTQFSPLNSLLNGASSSLLPSNATKFSNNRSSESSTIGQLSQTNDKHSARQNSFELFNRVLQQAYSKLAFNPNENTRVETTTPQGIAPSSLANYSTPLQSVDKISSEQAAGTILKFIEARLKSDAANGATNEELLNRLDQGLEGFIKGFNEAKGIIEDLGLLTPELSQEIGDTYQRVTNRIEFLQDKINGRDNLTNEDTNEVRASTTSRSLSLQTNNFQSESFSLSLTTQDGDRVTVEISQSNQSQFSAQYAENGESFSFNSSQQTSSNFSFNLNIQGELDQGELEAIDNLLQNINGIATDFYAGNLDQAFASASSLELDRSELSSLNLQLQQTTTTRAIASYESNLTQQPTTPSIDLANLLEQLDGILSDARTFNEPLKLVSDIFDKTTANIDQLNEDQTKLHDLNGLIGQLISQFDL